MGFSSLINKLRKLGFTVVVLLSILIIVIMISLVFVYVGTLISSEVNYQKYIRSQVTPYNYPASVWKSEDPIIVLEVSDTGNPDESSCIIESGNEIIEVSFILGDNGKSEYKYGAFFKKDDSKRVKGLVEFESVFTREKAMLTITFDKIFNWKYETITLIRVE